MATAVGAVAIASISVGDQVLAYDEASGQTASYPVSAVHVNADPVTGTVVIGGETIETTPEHPFYTLEAGWLDAQELEPGMHVPSASGEPGAVEAVDFNAGPATMYNLTVEVAHTFFVGDGAWLVHNIVCDGDWPEIQYSMPGNPIRPGSHGNLMKPDPRAEGMPHTVFKRNPVTQRVEHYSWYRQVNAYGIQNAKLRFRGSGREPHGGGPLPVVYRPKTPGSRPVVRSTVRSYDVSRGYLDWKIDRLPEF
ncbi:MAG: polymorphic toxin-type HINT domain-containing protein [Chloroflexota bacterium]